VVLDLASWQQLNQAALELPSKEQCKEKTEQGQGKDEVKANKGPRICFASTFLNLLSILVNNGLCMQVLQASHFPRNLQGVLLLYHCSLCQAGKCRTLSLKLYLSLLAL